MQLGKSQNNFDTLNHAKFGKSHLKVILVSGAGFFTDAYDLFCINLVLPMIGYVYYYDQPHHSIPGVSDSLVKSSAAWGNLIGQLMFGYLADKFGRKKIYGLELMIMIIATIGSAFSINLGKGLSILYVLIFWRFILGIGIGGDYPVSSVITSEFANIKHRGLMISSVFAMQGLGMLTGSIIALIFLNVLKSSIQHEIGKLDFLWRICLGFGIMPAMIALYFRIKINESPRYLNLTQNKLKPIGVSGEPKLSIEITTGTTQIAAKETKDLEDNLDKQNGIDLWNFLCKWKNLKILFGCSFSWFALDVAFYGSNLNQSFVLETIGFSDDKNTFDFFEKLILGNLIITFCGAFPGYWFTVFLVDKIGRKLIQMIGFVISGFCWLYLAAAYTPLTNNTTFFLIIYIVAQFFLNFGPNTTTFVIPGELFPTKFRATCHGIAAASGKAGAILAAQGFSILKDYWGVPTLLYIFSVFMLLGFFSTFLIPETKGKSLEELENHFVYTNELKPETNVMHGGN